MKNQNSIEQQIYDRRKEVKYDTRDITLELINNKYSDGLKYINDEYLDNKRNVLFIPEYQRDFTWDSKRKSKLIESIILGLPIPFIFVAENSDSAWEIVDGSQRIRTIHSFLNNELTLEGLEYLNLINGLKFNDLDPSRQGKILDTFLRFVILSEETTEDVKLNMFERINRGSDLLKPMETRKGVYKGLFTTFLYDYVKNNTLYNELTKVDKWLENRQEKEELLLRFFAISDKHNYKKDLNPSVATFLDEYLDKKNKELENLNQEQQQAILDELKKKIDSILPVVKELFPFGFRHAHNPQTKRAVFESISIGTWLAVKNNKIILDLTKEKIEKALSSNEYRQFTHVANKSHKKEKLLGRINYIYKLLTGEDL